MKLNSDTLRAPSSIFIVYMVSTSLLVLAFYFIFPREVSPLPIFSISWRLLGGLLGIVALFPALALSALVLPFGLPDEDDAVYTKFSAHLFQRMISPMATAICAAIIYAALYFLVFPLAQNAESNMRYQGEMYQMAKEKAHQHARAREWLEASQFIGIADSVWENSPELELLRKDIDIGLAESSFTQYPQTRQSGASVTALPGHGQPADAPDAIAMSETALNAGRYFDAHWLATLGRRLARDGSPEVAAAALLASRAWNQIESQQPSRSDIQAFSFYRQKRQGYEAMNAGDWIQAFYIFRDLTERNPSDPDVWNFLAASENGTREIAFFVNEMQVFPGETLTGVMFSLPGPQERDGREGRSILRISSLAANPDYAYGIGVEYMVFGPDAEPLLSLQAPYAKILPITVEGRRQALILMRALDRYDSGWSREPQWVSQRAGLYHPDSAQITLDISYETFLMLSHMRQGLSGMNIAQLFDALEISRDTGYIPEVFGAEILHRLGAGLFFLPMAVIAIIIGWNFRARRRPRYMFILSFAVLPLVFNGLVYLCKAMLNTVGTSLILAAGFSAALVLLIIILSLSFVVSLIILASQHG